MDAPQLTVFTVGHSTRTLIEFVEMLKAHKVALVIDVRSVPRSRHNPQFSKEILPALLEAEGLDYVHIPEIGGLRRPNRDSVNTAWRNKSFRGYADFMQTKEFNRQLLHIMALARMKCAAIMCAEALPWRCHRSLIADALIARNVRVEHIISSDSVIRHKLTEWAHIEGTKITYPLFERETPQKALGDFGSTV